MTASVQIRYRGVPNEWRVQRVETPRPAPPPPAEPALPFKNRPAPAPVREGLPAFHRRKAASQAARAAREAVHAPPATEAQVSRALSLEGVTQRDLAALLGVSRSSVAETVRGRRQTPKVRQWAIDVLTRHGALDAAPALEAGPEEARP